MAPSPTSETGSAASALSVSLVGWVTGLAARLYGFTYNSGSHVFPDRDADDLVAIVDALRRATPDTFPATCREIAEHVLRSDCMLDHVAKENSSRIERWPDSEVGYAQSMAERLHRGAKPGADDPLGRHLGLDDADISSRVRLWTELSIADPDIAEAFGMRLAGLPTPRLLNDKTEAQHLDALAEKETGDVEAFPHGIAGEEA